MRRSDLGVVLTALMLAAGVARAQSLPRALAEPAARLPAGAREELQRHRATIAAMDTARLDDFRQRIAEWHAQPPAVQRERRERWQAWHALSPAERARIETAAREFAALPADRQQALRTRFDALDQSERHGWLLGPALGAQWPQLWPLFAQVPETQRAALLAALRDLPDAARADLAVLAWRVPPQERGTLRAQWLATPAAARAQWLRARVER